MEGESGTKFLELEPGQFWEEKTSKKILFQIPALQLNQLDVVSAIRYEPSHFYFIALKLEIQEHFMLNEQAAGAAVLLLTC